MKYITKLIININEILGQGSKGLIFKVCRITYSKISLCGDFMIFIKGDTIV